MYTNTLEQLWFSERHVQVVNDLVEGRREKYSLCRNCPLSPTGPEPSGKKIQIDLRNRAVEKSA
jgi:hypothetical protein